MKDLFKNNITYIAIILLLLITFLIIDKCNNRERIIIRNTPVEKEIETIVDTIIVTDYRIDTIYTAINNLNDKKNEEIQKAYTLSDSATVNLFYQLVSR